MAKKELQAIDLVAQAEKKCKKTFGLFGGKYDEALEKYQKAANLFKLCKKWEKAGDVFTAMANVNINKLKSVRDAARNYSDAANVYRKLSDTDKAIDAMKLAVDINTDQGNFNAAAKQEKIIAEICEEGNNYEDAVEHYSLAADYFDTENSTSSANAMKLKKAHFSAHLKMYAEAIDIYEQVAKASVDNNLIRFSVKDYLFKAMLCHFAMFAEQSEDERNIEPSIAAHEQYCEIDVNYEDSREGTLVQTVLDGVQNEDLNTIMKGIRAYDRISKLDHWKSSLLLKVKSLYEDDDADDLNSTDDDEDDLR